MEKKVKITEKIFRSVKIMLAGGATHDEIHEYLGVSLQSIYRIKHSENYEEYRQVIAAMALKNAERKKAEAKKAADKVAEAVGAVPASTLVKEEPERKSTVSHVVQLPYSVTQEMKRTNELLELISKKLVYIVEQLS